MAKEKTFKTIFPAVSVPLNEDMSINEAEFRVYLRWIKSFYGKGIEGLVCNGHTGEITGLSRAERKRVIEICAEECGDVMTIISGLNCENTIESIEMAKEAKEAGAVFNHKFGKEYKEYRDNTLRYLGTRPIKWRKCKCILYLIGTLFSIYYFITCVIYAGITLSLVWIWLLIAAFCFARFLFLKKMIEKTRRVYIPRIITVTYRTLFLDNICIC